MPLGSRAHAGDLPWEAGRRRVTLVSTLGPLPEKAAETTAERPWPVRVLSIKIADYVDKMSQLWVEGQVVQFTPRGGTAFLTLRDPDVDMSLSVSVPMNAVNAMSIPLTQGARVVLQAKPTFWTKRGSLQLEARQIRPVGIGDLLARVEMLKRTLAAEGVFDAERKRPIPFLPHRVGLVTGRNSAAEKDVVENARRRWPAVRFEIREVAVQGSTAVAEVVAALAELDAQQGVDVIVIARGGGALEELLPFSNEAMIRAVAAARTPVISAIGHDVDSPSSTSSPTGGRRHRLMPARRVVPDAAREIALVAGGRDRLRSAIERRIESERRGLRSLVSRPVLADPDCPSQGATRRARGPSRARGPAPRGQAAPGRRPGRAPASSGHRPLAAVDPGSRLRRGPTSGRTHRDGPGGRRRR